MKTKYLLLFYLSTLSASATIVNGTIASPIVGINLSGTCSIQAITAPFNSGQYTIVGSPVVVPFNLGVFTANLVPTDSATPLGQYYRVTCQSPAQTVNGQKIQAFSWGPQFWLVPTSLTPVTIATVQIPVTPVPSVMILPLQIQQAGAVAGDVLSWTGSSWQPRGITLNRYAFPVSGTSITLQAIYHGLGTNIAVIGCQDASGNRFQPGNINIDSSGNITITSSNSMTGLCVVTGSPTGIGQYTATFTSVTSLNIPETTAGLGFTPQVSACYDAFGNQFEPGAVIVDSVGNMTITFNSSATGKCILQ